LDHFPSLDNIDLLLESCSTDNASFLAKSIIRKEDFAMKKSKYKEGQIAFALRQAETGTPSKEVIRKMEMTEQTLYRWKKKYGVLGTSEVRRLRQLEEENRKLKQ
jgi:putative transposase